MEKKTSDILEKEISLVDILKTIYNHKLIVILITLVFGVGSYIIDDNNSDKLFEKNQEIQTNSLLRTPPEHLFVNFINNYQSFFSELYEIERKSIIQYERKNYHDIFILKFLSLDNFISFLEKKNYSELLNVINQELNNKNTKFEKRIGFANFKDPEFKDENNTETVFLRHNLNIDGQKILTEYIRDAYEEASNIYREQKKKEFSVIISIYKNALHTAEKLDIVDPFIVSRKRFNFENKTTEMFTTADIDSLYLKGTTILSNVVEEMNSKMNFLGEFQISFNPIIDTAFTFSSNEQNQNIDKTLPNYIRGLLLGFFISLIAVYIKTLFEKKSVD